MGKFFKFLGIYIGIMLIVFLVSSIFATGNSTIISTAILKYGAIIVGIIVFFFFFISVASELDDSTFWMELIAYIAGSVGYLLFHFGQPGFGTICVVLCTSITSLGACKVSERLFSYYEEVTTSRFRWDDFFEKWDKIGESKVVNYVDCGVIGFILHLVIFLLPCLLGDEMVPLVLFILLSIRFVLKTLPTIVLAIYLFFYILFHPSLILSFIGRFWYIFAFLAVGGIAAGIIFGVKNADKEPKIKDYGSELYSRYDSGSVVEEATCTKKGKYTYKCLNGNPDLSYEIPCNHQYNSNNECTDCHEKLEYSKDRLLYTVKNEGTDNAYVEIYGYLPGHGDLIVPPYIDGVEVKNIHLSAYDPSYEEDWYLQYVKNSTNLDPSNKTNREENKLMNSVYGKNEYGNFYVYTASNKTNLYLDISYSGSISCMYVIGDLDTIYLRDCQIYTIIFTGKVNELWTYATDMSLVFMDTCRAIWANWQISLPRYYVSLPRGLEYFNVTGVFSGFSLDYKSDYFKVVDGELYSSDTVFHAYKNRDNFNPVKDKKSEALSKNKYNLKKGSINFDVTKYSYKYYDYRHTQKEGDFVMPLGATHVINTAAEFDYAASYLCSNPNNIIELGADIDFKGKSATISTLRCPFDGKGHTLKNILIDDWFGKNQSSAISYGIVKNLSGSIKNLTLANVKIKVTKRYSNVLFVDELNMGILVGKVLPTEGKRSQICNVNIINSSITFGLSNALNIGGLVGSAKNCDFKNISIENVNIKSDYLIPYKTTTGEKSIMGGIVGYSQGCSFDHNKFVDSTISGKGSDYNADFYSGDVGGIVGLMDKDSSITACLVKDVSFEFQFNENTKKVVFSFAGLVGQSNSGFDNMSHSIVSGISVNSNGGVIHAFTIEGPDFSGKYNADTYLLTDSDLEISYTGIPLDDEYQIKKVDFLAFALPDCMNSLGFSIINGSVDLALSLD